MRKIFNIDELIKFRQKVQSEGKRVVFTNGCFDIIHRGHIELLKKAKEFGDILIIGLNSDFSVKRIKGEERPILNEDDRAYILGALECVDAVCLFDEETPGRIIEQLKPDVLVKGGDYEIDEIVGRETVKNYGGEVIAIPLVEGKSTRGIIEKIIKLYCK
jgi:D-beta-D-heptose 7-phosphate kinase/D-beta-D-heptose 1-phosphate adenosyltransferase